MPLPPGALWNRLTERTAAALASGALRPIPTEIEHVEDGGVRFIVRVVESLARKRAATITRPSREPNPFLPYDPEMFVADVSDTHVALLNRFNVVDHHLLIVTRAFEDQEDLLSADDFAATWTCMAEYPALAFYNAGEVAGASQRHKHLQMVPVPMARGGPDVPIEPLLSEVRFDRPLGVAPRLRFGHLLARVEPGWLDEPARAGEATRERYVAMLRRLGIAGDDGLPARPTVAYNLLVTRRFMLVVPRSRESFGSISVNALGFAGALLVRNDDELRAVRRSGPMAVLRAVGRPGAR